MRSRRILFLFSFIFFPVFFLFVYVCLWEHSCVAFSPGIGPLPGPGRCSSPPRRPLHCSDSMGPQLRLLRVATSCYRKQRERLHRESPQRCTESSVHRDSEDKTRHPVPVDPPQGAPCHTFKLHTKEEAPPSSSLRLLPRQRNSQQCCYRYRQSNAIRYIVPRLLAETQHDLTISGI